MFSTCTVFFIQVKDSVSVPVVANGDIFNLSDVTMVHRVTGVDGVMCARGLLHNPALFAGHTQTPLKCIEEWVSWTTADTVILLCIMLYKHTVEPAIGTPCTQRPHFK